MLLFCPHCSNILRIAQVSASRSNNDSIDDLQEITSASKSKSKAKAKAKAKAQAKARSKAKANIPTNTTTITDNNDNPPPSSDSDNDSSSSSSASASDTPSAPIPNSTVLKNRFECPTCTYICPIGSERRFFEEYIATGSQRKEVEDVIGGRAAWENAQKTDTRCRADEACEGTEAMFYEVQIRSADEPMTGFYKCTLCLREWRE